MKKKEQIEFPDNFIIENHDFLEEQNYNPAENEVPEKIAKNYRYKIDGTKLASIALCLSALPLTLIFLNSFDVIPFIGLIILLSPIVGFFTAISALCSPKEKITTGGRIAAILAIILSIAYVLLVLAFIFTPHSHPPDE